jgi:hypothetical protein
MQRTVTQLPLTELWDEAGKLPATYARDLTEADIRTLLQATPVRFVIADVGKPLQWVQVSECFRFWKTQVRSRVAGATQVFLDDFPGGHCYFASEWQGSDRLPIVLLSLAH